jgi:hypothetical protein
MPIRYLKKHAALEGTVTADDAEALGQWVQAQAAPAVHLGRCAGLHSAALQVLLCLQPRLLAPPPDPWLAAVLGPLPTPRPLATPAQAHP